MAALTVSSVWRASLVLCIAAATLSLGLPRAAVAQEQVVLHASFSPDRLGASTTIGFGFEIKNGTGADPLPLTGVDLELPPGIGYLTTTLGLATCTSAALLAHGLEGCSPNARLGFGSAFVEVPFGTTNGYEIPDIQALMGPPHNGNTVVLFYAEGLEPIYAQIVFQGELIDGSATHGGSLDMTIPLIPSVAGGPPVSIVNVHATIGPSHLTYYEHVHGKTVRFHPQGVTVPRRCPRGGFRFSARFDFQDGSSTLAKATVPCPARRRR